MKTSLKFLKSLEFRMIKIEKDELEKVEDERSKLSRFVSKSVVIKRLFEQKKTEYIKSINNKSTKFNVRNFLF